MYQQALELDTSSLQAPTTPLPMARSPSRESLATDLSLMSLSSLGSDIGRLRTSSFGHSRKDDGWNSRGSRHCLRLSFEGSNRRHLAGEILFEEDTEMVRNCGALCSALGLMKSFSTSDLDDACLENEPLRSTVSELALPSWRKLELNQARHEHPSRSCSTWVSVGESTSQPAAKDFVRSVNQKIRQVYIRRRLAATYKALERLTRSQLNLHDMNQQYRVTSLGFQGTNKTLCLTVRDIERDKGKPLSKYERNMMIFTWLQSLDENAFDNLA